MGALDEKERVVSRLILQVDSEGKTVDHYFVGQAGVTSIRAVLRAGEHAYIPYFRVWMGDDLIAEVCQHRVHEVIYKRPNEFHPNPPEII